jgi:hypothetical protein
VVAAYDAGEGESLWGKKSAEWVTTLRSHLVDAVATDPREIFEKVPVVCKYLHDGSAPPASLFIARRSRSEGQTLDG